MQSEQYTGPVDNLEALMREEFGWKMPVEALAYWVRGVPVPQHSHETLELDADGRLSFLDQRGWQLEIASYRDQDGLQLPARLSLRSG